MPLDSGEKQLIATDTPSEPKPSLMSLSEKGKELLSDTLAPVQADLDALGQHLIDLIPAETKSAKDIISHVFAAGGKRIRPAFFFFSCRLTGYRGDHFFPIAAVCEYVHTASLLHDDVVDCSSLRRNKPTAHKIWGDESSVLVGDLIYSRASELMAQSGSLEIVKTFAEAIRLMSEGELYQLEAVFNVETPVEHYLRIINRKTAVLMAASCRAAGILAQVSQEQIEALSAFGESVGTAFQLVDDALDYLGSREVFGKPTLSDLREGKITMPVLLLRDLATAEELAILRAIVDCQVITTAQVETVAKIVEKYETAEATIELAKSYTDQALTALEAFAPSEPRDALANLANRLVWRFN